MHAVVSVSEENAYSGSVLLHPPSVTVMVVVVYTVYAIVSTVTAGTVGADSSSTQVVSNSMVMDSSVTVKIALPCWFKVATYARPLRAWLALMLCRPPMYRIVMVTRLMPVLLSTFLAETALVRVNTAL